jgi:tellurite resistance protein
MTDFFPQIEVTHAAAEAIARGLYAVAKVDGLHEREEALVASFWSEVGGGAGALAELRRAATIGTAELVANLPDQPLRHLFVKTAMLMAWADGKVTDAERKIISEYALALQLSSEEVQSLESSVKEYLLGHLATVKNSAAVAKVASKLDL